MLYYQRSVLPPYFFNRPEAAAGETADASQVRHGIQTLHESPRRGKPINRFCNKGPRYRVAINKLSAHPLHLRSFYLVFYLHDLENGYKLFLLDRYRIGKTCLEKWEEIFLYFGLQP